jgi:hypothetical protein
MLPAQLTNITLIEWNLGMRGKGHIHERVGKKMTQPLTNIIPLVNKISSFAHPPTSPNDDRN